MSKKNTLPLQATDLLGEVESNEPIITTTKELSVPRVGDIVNFGLRAINDGGEIQVFPAIVLEAKGTSAKLKIFRETFDEYITKAPQSFSIQAGFWTQR